MRKSDLGRRMKLYEKSFEQQLLNGVPVIIRLDGRAFHTFTKGLKKPFDDIFNLCMQETMRELCENISNCVFGYTQSDEITLVLIDNKSGVSHPWFDNRVGKIITASATLATNSFNKTLLSFIEKCEDAVDLDIYKGKLFQATFDARAFNVPLDDVVNNLIWRQMDATKNSINAVAQANFTHKELIGKTCSQMQEMLFSKKGINWNDTPTRYKRGVACVRRKVTVTTPYGEVLRNRWVVDTEMPILTKNRDYVENELHKQG